MSLRVEGLLPVSPIALPPVPAATVRNARRRPDIHLTAIVPAAFLRATLGLFRKRRLAGGLAQFLLETDRATGGIQHFEQTVVGRSRLRVHGRVAESIAQQLRGFQDRFPLPALQRVDPENSRGV